MGALPVNNISWVIHLVPRVVLVLTGALGLRYTLSCGVEVLVLRACTAGQASVTALARVHLKILTVAETRFTALGKFLTTPRTRKC